MSTNKSKYIVGYITIGVLIGFAIAYIGYRFMDTKEFKSTLESQEQTISDLQQHPDSITNTKTGNSSNDKLQQNGATNEEVNLVSTSNINVDISWQSALDQNSYEGFLNFIKTNNESHKNYNEAIYKLGQTGTRGWLYAGRTIDQSTYSEDQVVRTTWQNTSAVNKSNKIQNIGDIVTLISSSARRTYQNFTPRIEQNGVWQKEQEAYVSGIEIEGQTAVIIQVIYPQF